MDLNKTDPLNLPSGYEAFKAYGTDYVYKNLKIYQDLQEELKDLPTVREIVEQLGDLSSFMRLVVLDPVTGYEITEFFQWSTLLSSHRLLTNTEKISEECSKIDKNLSKLTKRMDEIEKKILERIESQAKGTQNKIIQTIENNAKKVVTDLKDELKTLSDKVNRTLLEQFDDLRNLISRDTAQLAEQLTGDFAILSGQIETINELVQKIPDTTKVEIEQNFNQFQLNITGVLNGFINTFTLKLGEFSTTITNHFDTSINILSGNIIGVVNNNFETLNRNLNQFELNLTGHINIKVDEIIAAFVPLQVNITRVINNSKNTIIQTVESIEVSITQEIGVQINTVIQAIAQFNIEIRAFIEAQVNIVVQALAQFNVDIRAFIEVQINTIIQALAQFNVEIRAFFEAQINTVIQAIAQFNIDIRAFFEAQVNIVVRALAQFNVEIRAYLQVQFDIVVAAVGELNVMLTALVAAVELITTGVAAIGVLVPVIDTELKGLFAITVAGFATTEASIQSVATSIASLPKKVAQEVSSSLEKEVKDLSERTSEEVCSKIVGTTYYRWDLDTNFYPTLVFIFEEEKQGLRKRQTQIKSRLPFTTENLPDDILEILRKRIGDTPELFYSRGPIRASFVHPQKRWKTTIFVKEKEDAVRLLEYISFVSGTELAKEGFSFTVGRNKNTQAKLSRKIKGIEIREDDPNEIFLVKLKRIVLLVNNSVSPNVVWKRI